MILKFLLWQIGGIGPELDEDFSTSYLMTTHGYKGAFSLKTAAGILIQSMIAMNPMRQLFPQASWCT